MLSISLNGVEAVDAKLAAYPNALAASLGKASDRLAAALLDKIVGEKLSGGVLQSGTGALAASITSNVAIDSDTIIATIASSGVKYARIQEYGGKTAAHEIVPVKGQALAFVVGGAQRFARSVNHPGSQIPERSYLRSSLSEMSDLILAEFSQAADDSWGRT
jgi:phage gpG-like protein